MIRPDDMTPEERRQDAVDDAKEPRMLTVGQLAAIRRVLEVGARPGLHEARAMLATIDAMTSALKLARPQLERSSDMEKPPMRAPAQKALR